MSERDENTSIVAKDSDQQSANVTSRANEEDELFEDAPSSFQRDQSTTSAIDEKTGMETMHRALNLMLNNQYFEAEAILKPWADVSSYHCVGYGTILFLQAMMSFESDAIDQATSVLQDAVGLLNLQRKKQGMLESISGIVFGQKMDTYSPNELLSEIFFAECNMLLSLLTFFQDESLMSFIKGGLRIRQCYTMYKSFHSWIETSTANGVTVDPEFLAGVQLGIGCFNLIISLLPQRILKLLEFVGFSGNRILGLQELTRGSRSTTLHSSMCSSFLLFYHTVASVILGLGDSDVDQAQGLLDAQLQIYPNSVLFKYFKGRVMLLKGEVDQAITCFKQAIEVQDQWRTVHHLCWWELKWCYCFKGQWAVAAEYADKLFQESKWSKATFLYQKAAFLLMLRHKTYLPEQENPVISCPNSKELEDMMLAIPPYKQRIAGKSIPVEKFVIAKSERCLEGARLPLCGLEMIYAWNGFQLLSKNRSLLDVVLRVVWDELMTVEETQETNPHYVDDWAVVTLLQGVCFKGLQRYDEAQRCFQAVVDRSGEIQHDHYTAPAANMELGLLQLDLGNFDEAEKILESAKNAYKGYHLESRIHFRIHAGMCRISQKRTLAH